MHMQGRKSIDSKKRKKSETSSLSDNTFIDLEIRDFCPKRIFDIILINGNDADSAERLNEIITTAKDYEEVAFITFIRFDEVLDVLNEFDYDVISDNTIKGYISNLIDDIGKTFKHLKPENYPPIRLALLMKIKLIEVMSRHRKREIEKIEKRSVLFQALNSLAKECRKGTKESKAQKEKNSVKDATRGYIDTESDVVFDDDIFNHVWFYVFEGFLNVKVLNHFVNSTRVSLTAIIKFTTETYAVEYSQLHRKFWNDLDEYLYGHNRLENLENTMLMTFTANDQSDMDIFENLWHVIKGISNIKIQHLNYIRHLKIYEMQHNYEYIPLSCCTTYNKIMSNIPLPLSNEITILSSMLEETCFRLDKGDINDRYSLKENMSKIALPFSSKKSCPDPCNVSHASPKVVEHVRPLKKYTTSYQCYDGDYLCMIVNMYKPIGKVVNELSLNVLKNLRPFYLLDYDYPHSELIHKHDVAPSGSRLLDKSEYLEDFLKLLIIASFRKEEEETTVEPVDFVSNLVTYDVAAFRNALQVMLFDGDSSTKLPVDKTFRPSPMDYYWKEKYPSQVILQELLKVQYEFGYMDTIYCSDIERLLVSFHDDLDDFGINTQVFYESVCTPVCLRDFCRYVVTNAADWLNKNKPPTYVRKIEESEECPGTKKVRKMNIFPEYRHLLETVIVTEDETSETAEDPVSPKQDSTAQNNEVTFDEMISELENYPSNKKLMFECDKPEFPKDFLAYDFAATKYFDVKGARTTFASHDNVKIVVDNTKLVDENNRCTVNLKYMNNNLILHSHEMFKDSYSFHWLLDDGTIIVFEIMKTKRKSVKIPEAEISVIEENDVIGEMEEKEQEIDVVEKFVKTLDEKHLKELFPESLLENKEVKAEDELEEEIFEDISNDIFLGLNEAIRKNLPIYKIHKDYEAIMLKHPVGRIPLINIIQRVLNNNRKNLCQPQFSEDGSSRKFIPTSNILQSLTVLDEISFRITLPNGIYLTCYPSQIKEHLVEIKQEQLSTDIKSLRIEEFRLFTREGYILIKKMDGTIRLLMSNGNQIDFEKPDSKNEEIQNSPLKKYHCKNLKDYKKKLNKLMKTKRVERPYYISRRGALKTKKGYVINKDIIKTLESSKLPYLKTTLLNFEGNRTVLAKNKLTQKKLYHTISENDFVKEEISFERKDGLKCVLEKNGNRIVQFTDGTRISTSVRTSPELVDGYVYINLYYKYEHPYYATVIYEVDDLMQIVLNNNVVLEKTTNRIITLTLDEIVTTSVSADEVRFVKQCDKCQRQYTCLFNIAPFHTNAMDFTGEFLHAEDTYGKHFFVDFAGNCKNNASYKSGPLNLENCNHQVQTTYKRLFSLNKSFSGEQFYTDHMVNNLKEEQRKKENTSIVERKVKRQQNEHLLLEFNTKYFESFTECYMSKAVVRSEVTLSKYKQISSRPLYYSTNKFIIKVLTTKLLTTLLKTLMSHLSPDFENSRLKCLLAELVSEKQREDMLKRKAAAEKASLLFLEADKNCRCVKEKSTFAGKIARWQDECEKFRKLIRERSIPLYFQSEFCQPITE